MNRRSAQPNIQRLRAALDSAKYTGGSTHGFYLYPARFSPEIARAVIETFSEPGDSVLDPFMGGGTAIVEGLSVGRSMIGVDLNALALFVATARTRPLSHKDAEHVRAWAVASSRQALPQQLDSAHIVENLPRAVETFVGAALSRVRALATARQRSFARAVLLRLGQWALDCRDRPAPSWRRLAGKLPELTDQMLSGLGEFVEQCQRAGLTKAEIVSRRLLLHRNAAGIHEDHRLVGLAKRPRLVFTSPPYPRVHVLYHRWQVRGRKETPAPFWIAQVPDGHYASHYTGGSRTPTGERTYFSMIRSAFASVKKLLARDGLVVQLIGFADVDCQLPRYLATMKEAGFDTWKPAGLKHAHLSRNVPNRKWYAKLQGGVDTSSELLLFHRPRH